MYTTVQNFVKIGHMRYHVFFRFLARDVIYTSRASATMSVSVCLSVCMWWKCIGAL